VNRPGFDGDSLVVSGDQAGQVAQLPQGGATSEESAELRRLRRENHELRRANEILKAASAFFARELDPRLPHS
jgi:transposase-like protein